MNFIIINIILKIRLETIKLIIIIKFLVILYNIKDNITVNFNNNNNNNIISYLFNYSYY